MRIFLLAAAVLLLSVPARAAFEDLGAGARGPGLGDAFTALADDAYAIHYNPAGLSQLERPEFGAAYSKLYMGLSDGSDLGSSQLMYAHPLAGGRNGTLGLGWERFALSGIYTEQALIGSYGRRVWADDEQGSALMAGVSAKYLTHSFTTPAEAANSCNQGLCGQGADPVLSGAHSRSVPDADIGFLYRFPRRFQAGLTISHVTAPNVAFAGSDKLDRAYNLGGAYKSLWLSLIGELKVHPVASGGLARDAVFAAERYFPTLDYGQFGLRGSVGFGVGNSDRKQMTVGASYRVNKVQFDYAFLIPVGAVAGQSGSHRMGLSFHFGAPTRDDEISRELLDQAKRLRERGPDYGYEYSQELKPQDLSDPRLADVRRLIEERRYRLAKKALTDLAAREPLSQPLVRLSNRLDMAAYYYTDLLELKDGFDKTLAAGLRRFFYGQDRLALLQISYAAAQKPEDARAGHLLDDMEKALGIKATRLASDNPRGFIDEMLYQAEYANTRGDGARVESLLNDILVLEPENATALERLGSLRYLTGHMPEAIAAWEAAAKLETREKELESLREYLKLAHDRAAGKVLPGGATPVVPVLAPEPVEAPVIVIPAAPVRGAAAPSGDPRDVDRLYQRGVEHYARGEYLEASSMFLRILQIDPGNEQARKALERINRVRSQR